MSEPVIPEIPVEAENAALAVRARHLDETVLGRSTVCGTLGEEIATHLFRRVGRPELQRAAGASGDAVVTFAAIGRRKDNSIAQDREFSQ